MIQYSREGLMKKIGLIFAMEDEFMAMQKKIMIEKEYHIFELPFYEATINDTKCILTISGVGKVNAARTTQILIDNYQVDDIINVGVAGGLSNNLDIGDIVVGEKLVQHDFDITSFKHEKGYIPNVGTFVNSDAYLLLKVTEILQKKNYAYQRGVIASGDIFCTEKKMGEKIYQKFNALCVEMEGASIAQVCFLSHIPFLVLRSISDIPNNHNVMTYDKFLKDSSERIATVLYQLIESLDI